MIEGFVPGYLGKLAVLIELAVLLAQQRFGQAILAVHDLGQEITLDAGQALVDRCIGVALGGDHPAILDANQYRTPRTTETAGRLVPAYAVILACCLRNRYRQGNPCRCSCSRHGLALDKITTC